MMMNKYKDFWYNLSEEDKKKALICITELIYRDTIENRLSLNASCKNTFGLDKLLEQEFIDLQYFFSIYNYITCALEDEEDKAMI